MFQKYIPYTRVPSAPDDGLNLGGPSKHRFRPFYRQKVVLIAVTMVVGLSIVVFLRPLGSLTHGTSTVPETETSHQGPPKTNTDTGNAHQEPPNKAPEWIETFDTTPRPSWMDSPFPDAPLILRVAVMSHPREVKRRQIIRDYIFKGVRTNEVSIDYRFVVGAPEDGKLEALQREHEEHDDLVVLDFKDELDRLSQKRYGALKWAHAFSNASYDYFMNMDSDTFVRFGALARRLPTVFETGKTVNPRKDPIIIARMRPHWWNWVYTVSDDNRESTDEDLRLDGPWYSYPIGIGYMLSSFLVEQLLSTNPPLPHHIHYPNDDVMIGSWISSLNVFADPNHTFKVSQKNKWNVAVNIRPLPLLPKPVETLVVDDKLGWHDYQGRANVEEIGGPIGWDSVCVHHIKENELQMLRELEQFQGEWD